MKVILICGKARSGKNQLADYLAEFMKPNTALIRGNAETVKQIARDFYNWDGIKSTEGRSLLIDITNAGYKNSPIFWEEETLYHFRQELKANPELEYLIIPDWRYAITKEYFRDIVGEDNLLSIKVTRPNNEIGTHNNHSSENDFKNFEVDTEVVNDATLEHLKEVAKVIVERCCY